MKQLIPIILTVITCASLIILLDRYLVFLNGFPTKEKIILTLFPLDILVGVTIYLKTSIDFVLFIGNLMEKFPGIINRVAIELGTAVGNGLGTLLVLTIWTFFKEVPILMIIMITISSLVLLRMAEDSLSESRIMNYPFGKLRTSELRIILIKLLQVLKFINKVFDPLIGNILPYPTANQKLSATITSLFLFAFTIPFILGLDDFAGYIPLFSIINVFGFATGVFIGHMLLNILLFASPATTIKIVTLPIIMVAGGIAFIGLALFGFYEVINIFKTAIIVLPK